MFPTYSVLLQSLVAYIPPTDAGAKAHASALTALEKLRSSLTTILVDANLAGVPPQQADYAAIAEAINVHGAVIGGLLLKPSSTATTAAIALNQVRMHATRAIGAKAAVGSPNDWTVKLKAAFMDLELANARAIADADQRGEIA